MKEIKKNLPASIHQRLLNIARTENRTLNELLQYYAIERFLFRLGQTPARDKFILKGAQMLRAWAAPLSRPTKDIDLLGKIDNSVETLEQIVKDCCAVEVPDGVVFDPDTIRSETIKKDAKYQGVRIYLKGFMGKDRLNVQIDFAFGDSVIPAPTEIKLPQLLDLGEPRILGYTPESSIAEKFQAIVALDITNTRYKDFYDIWLLSENLEFDGTILAEAILATFQNRNTPLPSQTPNSLTERFTADESKQKQWQAFLRKNRLESFISLADAAVRIESFLMPIINVLSGGEEFKETWLALKGWHK